MAEDPAAAPAPASASAPSTLVEQLAAAAAAVAGAEQAAQAEGGVGAADKSAAIAALIRNGLSNGPIAQSSATWDHLTTRLPEIVAAIMKEL